MFDENEYMRVPEDENTVIWRYMNINKFESLLKEKALFFCSPINFKDDHEGAFSSLNIDLSEFVDEIAPIDDFTNKLRNQNNIYRSNIHISCWHMNETENTGMWDNYLDGKEGVAIKSSYRRFGDAVMDDPHQIFMGIVEYINYDTNIIPYNQGLWANYLRKREEFRYENEIRAMYLVGHNKNENETPGGFINTDLELLIEKVIVSPYSSNEFFNKVKTMVKDYGYDFIVKTSNMSKKPIF